MPPTSAAAIRTPVKPNKPKDMYYHGQVCVDSQHGVVTAAMGDYGDRKDLQSFPELLAKANKHVMLASMSLNLKKWLKQSTKTPKIKAHRAVVTPQSRDFFGVEQINSFLEKSLSYFVQKLTLRPINFPKSSIS